MLDNYDSTIEIGQHKKSERILDFGFNEHSKVYIALESGPSEHSVTETQFAPHDNPDDTDVETPIIRDRQN